MLNRIVKTSVVLTIIYMAGFLLGFTLRFIQNNTSVLLNPVSTVNLMLNILIMLEALFKSADDLQPRLRRHQAYNM
jgi:hypothetical protein